MEKSTPNHSAAPRPKREKNSADYCFPAIREHVGPDKITLGQWIEEWLEAGAPGRRRKKVSQRFVGSGGFGARRTHRDTVGSDKSKPSMSNSP